ncbi:MAG: hypothetical protein IT366_11425 [Candidatus Hydrogenedentes bacterium]|nr:hypothetical protein [Candidatus Hydrogenedentota bacterium]
MFPRLTRVLIVAFVAVPHAFAASPSVHEDAHVFLAGEPVRVAVPDDLSVAASNARAMNERLEVQRETSVLAGIADFGVLPVGWYRVEFVGRDGALAGFTTAAVLDPLAAPVPADSPIAVDVALSWLGAKDESDWPLYADLARLAGVRWVRDRIHWREVQSEDGAFADHTKYDDSAAIQSAEGLQILQVFHTLPKWALAPESSPTRPRLDLAKLYLFCKGVAARFRGKVQAWEPWNEGNASNFGGYTLDELCAIQKAAYLGFKAGDPSLTVCWNPLGGINIETQTRSILRNATWPYYDVYSIHSYDWPHGYEQYWRHAREAASGKPIWVTECDRGMQAVTGSEMDDFTPEYDRRKAEFVAQSYVRSLFSGSSKHFHFILGHYTEGENHTQFGLLRRDHTPRPGYVALAALGRLLADGVCLGRHEIDGKPNIHVYAFRAQPQGKSKDVLVAWMEGEFDWPDRGKERAPWPLAEPLKIDEAYDYLGRPLYAAVPGELRPDAVFLVMPEGESKQLAWRSVAPSKPREGVASCVVLQFDAPNTPPVQRTIEWSPEAAHEFIPGATLDATLTIYNFGDKAVAGSVGLDKLPDGWRAETAQWQVVLEPMAQKTVVVRLTTASEVSTGDVWLNFTGAFGHADQPVLAVWFRKPQEK